VVIRGNFSSLSSSDQSVSLNLVDYQSFVKAGRFFCELSEMTDPKWPKRPKEPYGLKNPF